MSLAFDSDGRPNTGAPILFVRFTWESGAGACRVPVSVQSLLGATATHFEISRHTALIQTFSNGEPRAALAAASAGWTSRLYDEECGASSVAVHLAADHLNITDLPTAYRYSSALAAIALNLPDDAFLEFNVPDSFAKWGDRNHAALVQRDRGYAYYLMLAQSCRTPTGVDAWLDETLAAVGLVGLAEFDKRSNRALGRIRVKLGDALYQERFEILRDLGDENRTLLGLIPQPSAVLTKLRSVNLCPVHCADSEWAFLGQENPLHDQARATEWAEHSRRRIGHLEEFVTACL